MKVTEMSFLLDYPVCRLVFVCEIKNFHKQEVGQSRDFHKER